MSKLTCLERNLIFSHPWEKIYLEKVKTPEGAEFDYLISEPNNFVIIVPFISKDTVLMAKQYKHGAKKHLLGFPAGFMKKNENPLLCAERELFEETGFRAKKMKVVAKLFENPSRCRNVYYVIFASKLVKTQKTVENSDKLEGKIDLINVPKEKFKDLSFLKKIEAGPMQSALPFVYTS